MAALDDLFAQIPVQDIAANLGVDSNEVQSTVEKLVPLMVGGLHEGAQQPDVASNIASAATSQNIHGLLDGGVNVDQVKQVDAVGLISQVFGGNDVNQVASAFSGAGGGNSDIIAKLLPVLAPIVLSYLGKQMAGKQAAQNDSGALGAILGSILGGAGGQSSNESIGNVIGNMIGGKAGGTIGSVLGGLFGK